MAEKKRILLVDDEPDFVSVVRVMLEREGYEVDTAYSGKDGLAKIKADPPDAVVLDVMMPDKDGYTVCKELKADTQLSQIPVLLLTAVVSHLPTTRYPQQRGLETEADDYVDKPVEPQVLVRRIENLLSR